MGKIVKNNKRAELNRNRVSIFRGVQSILRQDRIGSKFNVDSKIIEPKKNDRKSLAEQLGFWALDFNVRKTAVTALLNILRSNGLNFLPKDARTLLSTPRKVCVSDKAGGKFWQNGIRNALSSIFYAIEDDITIELGINTDGLPLFKSSALEFWPTLANILSMHNLLPIGLMNI